MTPLFGATIFLSAALAFLVEPLVARTLLPAFGGSAAVWATALVFFQSALLAGYAIAHLALTTLGVRRHAFVQVGLAVVGLLALVVVPLGESPATRPPVGFPPGLWLAGLLAVLVGIPFVVLSTFGPTLQRWYAAMPLVGAAQPYRLYAASNAGSLLGLLAYPLVVEPNFDLAVQGRLWTLAFGGLVVLTAGAAVSVRRASSARSRDGAPDGEPAPLGRSRRVRWVVLAAVPSALLVGVTTLLSTDVAAVPFLWIAPLGLYLVSLIVAYARARPIGLRLATAGLPALAILSTLAWLRVLPGPIGLLFAIHLATLFAAGVTLHGRLALSRPEPARLTEYTLLVALGGGLGGLAAGILGPLVFPVPIEAPIGLVAALLLRPAGRVEPAPIEAPAASRPRRSPVRAAAIELVAAPLVVGVAWLGLSGHLDAPLAGSAAAALLAVAPWRTTFAALVAILLVSGLATQPATLRTERTFYGTYRVLDDAAGRHTLLSGTTLHGRQDPADPRDPLTYYSRPGPLGQVIASLQGERPALRFGAVGLGVGTIAAYLRPGDRLTVFEIDPAVVDLARDPALFTYLRDARVPVDVVVDDGRLGLETVPPGAYDLLVLDAFSSDSVPVHLLTVEAMALELSRLAPGGAIAVHVSNRYLDLEPVVAAAAHRLGAVAIIGIGLPAEDRVGLDEGSEWVVVGRTWADLADLAAGPDWRTAHDRGRAPWTDRFSDLLGALRQ